MLLSLDHIVEYLRTRIEVMEDEKRVVLEEMEMDCPPWDVLGRQEFESEIEHISKTIRVLKDELEIVMATT